MPNPQPPVRCECHQCGNTFHLRPCDYRQRLTPSVRRRGVVVPRNRSGKLFCSKQCSRTYMHSLRSKQTGWEQILIAHGLGMRRGESNNLVYGHMEDSVFAYGEEA